MPVKIKYFAAAAALVLGACNTGLVRLQTEHNQSNYDFFNFTNYHGDRDTRVIIHGNPFAMDRAAFAMAVTDNMQGANPGRRTNFTTTPGKSAVKNLWVVMAFNVDMDAYDLCRDQTIKTRPQGRRPLALAAAWCFDGRMDSIVQAEVGPAGNADDPRFRALVSQTVLSLFPKLIMESPGGIMEIPGRRPPRQPSETNGS
jgi:hypothetical protein